MLKCKRTDLIANQMEDSFGSNTHKLFKVIAKDTKGEFPVEEGWKLVEDEVMQWYVYDQDFMDKFLHNSEMIQDFNDGNLAFVEGRKMSSAMGLFRTIFYC